MKRYFFLILVFIPLISEGQSKIKLTDEVVDNFKEINRKSICLNTVKLDVFKEMFCKDCEISISDLRKVVTELKSHDNVNVIIGKCGRNNNVFVIDSESTSSSYSNNSEVLSYINILNALLEKVTPTPVKDVIVKDFSDSLNIANALLILYHGDKEGLTNSQKSTLRQLKVQENSILVKIGFFFAGLISTFLGILLYFKKDSLFKKTDIQEQGAKDREDIKRGIERENQSSNNSFDISVLKESNTSGLNNEYLLNEEIKNLKKEIIKRDLIIESLKKEGEIDEKPRVVSLSPTISKIVFYLSTPNADGSFRDNRSNTMNPSRDVYEFELIDAGRAKFSLIDHLAVLSEAIAYPESYLKPVCDYDGGFNPNAKSVRVINKGFAILKGDKWELDKKALIKLT